VKYKLIHIFTDQRFIYNAEIFDNELIENTVLSLNASESKESLPRNINCLVINESDLINVVKRCNKADMVVLWSLNEINQKIALAIEKDIQIAWRFYGYELYGKIPGFLYSPSTLKLLENSFKGNLKRIPFIRSLVNKKKQKREYERNELFSSSVKRINYFLGLFEEEYFFLKNIFHDLPPFIKLPISAPDRNYSYHKAQKKGRKVIIGHNAFPINNHIDILEIIKRTVYNKGYRFCLLMNYGGSALYKVKIKSYTDRMPDVHVIENHIPKDEFDFFYSDVSTFVLNAYRQCGMANVYMALFNGVKIYLNRKNIVYDLLLKEGFMVFSVEDFASDLYNNNLELTENESIHNYNNFFKYVKRNSVSLFQSKILEIFQ